MVGVNVVRNRKADAVVRLGFDRTEGDRTVLDASGPGIDDLKLRRADELLTAIVDDRRQLYDRHRCQVVGWFTQGRRENELNTMGAIANSRFIRKQLEQVTRLIILSIDDLE